MRHGSELPLASRCALSGFTQIKEVREAQATLDEKNRTLGSYDELFGCGATTLTGLLRMAGKAELAAKVKPSTRRPGQTASDAGDAGTGAPTTGTGTGDK